MSEPATTDTVTAAMADALHGLLDAPGAAPGDGDALPVLWHWLAFTPRVPQRLLDLDGHPSVDPVLGPRPAGRRMYAGGSIEVDGSLPIGAPLRRISTIEERVDKVGRSGPLQFVTVRHELTSASAGHGRIVEYQQLVYLPESTAQAEPATVGSAGSAGSAVPPTPATDCEATIVPNETMLFRFSALTYNAHRIHYDAAYATEVEGYPGLVVHGPLQAILLAELCRRQLPGTAVRRFSFRAMSPAFAGQPLRTVATAGSDGEIELVATNPAGAVTMKATASLAG